VVIEVEDCLGMFYPIDVAIQQAYREVGWTVVAGPPGTIGRGFEDLVWPLALWGRPIISGAMQRAAELTQRP
jgi:hypothetical protein